MGVLKKILPQDLYRAAVNSFESIKGYANKSYSQEGEDLVLRRLFHGKSNGYYVDVGALHPKRFSNTYLFYKMGWRGINIEPRPGSMKLFNKYRPNDINLEIPIYDQSTELTYYMFNEPALNCFSDELSAKRIENPDYKLIGEKKIRTERLDSIFEKYIEVSVNLDFLSIDVEGLDYNVLNSNNWEKFRPTVILFEDITFDYQNIESSKSGKLLINAGYSFWAKTFNTLFFINNQKKNILHR